jgi:predicted Kef-type K+ transport protein
VGFLAAGFVLRAVLGYEMNDEIGTIADLGVTLMLFTIGLKLKIKDLLKPPVWAGATTHLLGTVLVFMPLLLLGGSAGLPYLNDLSLGSAATVAFALAFSSTVFAVVMFQRAGSNDASHAKLAIGVLIMQDIFAVAYLTISKGVMPTWLALPLLLGLWPLRLLLLRLLHRAGHGELLLMLGLLIPLGIAAAFEGVKLKGDLGALIIGMLLASSPKASELSKLLFSFKELFLVMFFISIGLRGDPTWGIIAISGLAMLALPLKTIGFYLVFSLFRVRSRQSLFATLSLSNYSEFGLIVGALAASTGIITDEWLLIFAIALSLSYVLAAPLTQRSPHIYDRWNNWFHRFESGKRLSDDLPIPVDGVHYIVIGMNHLGHAVARALRENHDNHDCVRGVDFVSDDPTVIQGNATDSELWDRIDHSAITAIFLTIPGSEDDQRQAIIRQLRSHGYQGRIIASTEHDDEIPLLLEIGANVAHAVSTDAGLTLAALADQLADEEPPAKEHV